MTYVTSAEDEAKKLADELKTNKERMERLRKAWQDEFIGNPTFGIPSHDETSVDDLDNRPLGQ
jgi:hypothetical protein